MNGKFIYFIYFQLIFLSIFTDWFWQEKYGYFGRSLMSFLIPVYFIIILVLCRKIEMTIYLRKFAKLLIYFGVVILLAVLIWKILGNKTWIYGENIYVKSIKLLTYWILIFLYMICVFMCSNWLDKACVWKPFVVTFWFLFVYLLLEYFSLPYGFHIGMSSGQYCERVRLTSTESSLTVYMILICSLATINYYQNIKKNKLKLIAAYIATGIFIITSGSKSLFALMMIMVCIYLSYYFKNLTYKRLAMLILFLLGGGFIIGIYTNILITGISDWSSSYGIRGTGVVAALLHAVIYPFGTGAISMHTVYQCMKWIYNWMLSNWDNYSQFVGYDLYRFFHDEAGTGIIAGIMDQTTQWGIVGTIYWIYNTVAYIKMQLAEMKEREKVLFTMMMSGIGILWLFFMPMTNHYMPWAAIIALGAGGKTNGNRED